MIGDLLVDADAVGPPCHSTAAVDEDSFLQLPGGEQRTESALVRAPGTDVGHLEVDAAQEQESILERLEGRRDGRKRERGEWGFPDPSFRSDGPEFVRDGAVRIVDEDETSRVQLHGARPIHAFEQR
jgi:hypothetical protein